jgi:predicted nucleic acid-binding protein
MSATIFVDTNILVYARDASEPRKQSIATEWLQDLWMQQRGRSSMQVLAEYYTIVTRKLKPGMSQDDAWDDVTALFAWEPQAVNRSVIARAREVEKRYRLSWWDAMIVAAAQLQNCALLLSEDLQQGLVCGTVTVRNPFEQRVEDEHGRYALQPVPVSRHRQRGRPRSRSA